MPTTNLQWGIDLGGTKIEGVVLRDRSGGFEILARTRLPTDAGHGYEHILERVHQVVLELGKQVHSSPARVGVGHPGVITPTTQRLKNSNTQCLNGQALQIDLRKKLGVDIHCANDANCFALAETIHGAAKGHLTVFGVILGTGVGGGIVINGRALYGRQGIAGEWGHNVLLPGGTLCYCGKRGCVETVISGPALEQHYSEQSGTSSTLEQIVIASTQGDNAASSTVSYLTEHFGKAIASVINILDPDCIVLGGGVSNVDALYTQGVIEAKRNVFNPEPDILIRKHELGDSAGVIGAAALGASS